MVHEQLAQRGIRDGRVLAAMAAVPRHAFVPPEARARAYDDTPLPIGGGQTISQPYLVAYMLEALHLGGSERVLEVGTGSGYGAAVLARLAGQVFSIERDADLGARAGERLAALELANVEVVIGDGSQGLPDEAPFDAIVVTAAAPEVPPPLRLQLADGGRLVLPVGDVLGQTLVRVTRLGERWQHEALAPVLFVPLRGLYGWEES
jgi:protein-L-isoaspartate(D-aspartate) O-methyltransferase